MTKENHIEKLTIMKNKNYKYVVLEHLMELRRHLP